MNEVMWFGTRGRMQWVACPQVGMPSQRSGYNQRLDFLNGGASVRRSFSGAKNYRMSWNMRHRADVRPIMDYAEGLYGTGAIYFSDWFAMDANVLPQSWANPSLAGIDGIILDNRRVRPELIPTPVNSNGYPVQTAVFDVTPAPVGAFVHNVYIPIPPGYTAWVGAHGANGTGGAVVATVSTGPETVGTATTLTLLPVDTAQRFNHSVSSTEGDGVIISLGGDGTIELSGLMVQVLRTGVTPQSGGFISGQGNSGCTFAEMPSYTPYSAAFDRVSLIADLVETEQWRATPNF